MASVPHEPALRRHERPQWAEFLRIPEMWASLGIIAMWIAVLFASVFGPNFVSSSGSGTSTTAIPSGVLVAFFAFLATAAVAKRAFRHDKS
jgi:hypothetical protein